MTNTPIGLGPNANISSIAQLVDARTADALQFRMQDKGSTTAELLRGKIGQLRMETTADIQSVQQPNFRELISPSTQMLKVIERLQNCA